MRFMNLHVDQDISFLIFANNPLAKQLAVERRG